MSVAELRRWLKMFQDGGWRVEKLHGDSVDPDVQDWHIQLVREKK